MESIKEVLMRRDDLSESDADDLIAEAKEELNSLLAEGQINEAGDICADYFGLEPDYLMDLIP